MNMNSDLVEQVIERIVSQGAAKQEAKQAEQRAAKAAREKARAEYLEESFRVMLNKLGDVGVALRPYMSQPAAYLYDDIVQVKVTGAPQLCNFVITCDLRWTDGENVWLAKAKGSNYFKEYQDVADALFAFRVEYHFMIEELHQKMKSLGDYSLWYVEGELADQIAHYLPDYWEHFSRQLQLLKLNEEMKAAQMAAYKQACQEWQAQVNQVKEENVAIVADLQDTYNTPYRLYTLSYSTCERDEYGEPLSLLTVTVLSPEPNGDGWWLVLSNNRVRCERFTTVVSVREEEACLPTKRGWGLYIDLPGYLTLRVSPFHWKELAEIEAQARAALKPLPPAPRQEDFGLEPEEDDVPY